MKKNLTILLAAASLMTVLAAGCQTSYPSSGKSSFHIIQRQHASGWNPQAAIVFDDEQRDSRIAKEFYGHLSAAARSAGIRIYKRMDGAAQEDLLIRIADVNQGSVSASQSVVIADTALNCTYNCYDRDENRLEGGTLRGSGKATQTDAAMLASVVLSVATLDVYTQAEKGAMQGAARRAAMKDLAANIVNMAADPDRKRQMLRKPIKNMTEAEITNLAAYLFSREQYESAQFYLIEAVEQFPFYQPAYCYLGACQAQLGKYEEAQKTFATAIQLDPQTQEAHQAQEWMDTLPR